MEINQPYTGTIVPLNYFQKNTNVQSLMIEVNRKLYMDQTTGKRHVGFRKLSEGIGQILIGILTGMPY